MTTSSIDSGVSEDSISIDESSGSDVFTSSSSDSVDSESPEPQEVTLMVNLTGEKCGVTIIHENGTVEPFTGNSCSTTEDHSIPLKLGVVRQKVFVFGNQVNAYETAQSDKAEFLKTHFCSFDLAKYLSDPNSSRPLKFFFDDDIVDAKFELLMAFFLGHLKEIVETYLRSCVQPISCLIRRLVIVVPQWYTSLHRQRLKDSAEIAGFHENFIVNETDALMALHLAARTLAPGTQLNVVVVSANSGNTDVVFYECEADNSFKVLASTGNFHSSSTNCDSGQLFSRDRGKQKYDELIKKSVSGSGKDEETKRKMYRRDFLHGLLHEIRQDLPQNEDPFQFVNCVLIMSDEKEWDELLQEEFGQEVIHYQHIGSPPHETSTSPWTPPSFSVENFTRKVAFKENESFNLYQTFSVSDKCRLKADMKVTRDSSGDLKASLAYPMERCVFYQKNVLGKKWEVGTLQVKPFFHYDHQQTPELEIHLKENHEGIISLVQVCGTTENRKRKWDDDEYLWLPANLTPMEKQEFSEKLKEMLQFSKTYQNDRSEAKDELWEICSDMADKLWGDEHSRLGKRQKKEMVEKVDKTLKMLKEMSYSKLMEVGMDELQRNLAARRNEYRMFFKGRDGLTSHTQSRY